MIDFVIENCAKVLTYDYTMLNNNGFHYIVATWRITIFLVTIFLFYHFSIIGDARLSICFEKYFFFTNKLL